MKKILLTLLVLGVLGAGGVWYFMSRPTIQVQPTLVREAQPVTSTSLVASEAAIDLSASSSVAMVTGLSGTGSVTRGEQALPLALSLPLQQGDLVHVDLGSQATIVWLGYGKSVLDADTTLAIDRFRTNPAQTNLIVELRLDVGRVWTRLEKLLETDSSFRVRAADVVATVRGTSFGVSRRRGKMGIQVTNHRVQVQRMKEGKSENEGVFVEEKHKTELDESSSTEPVIESMTDADYEDPFLVDADVPMTPDELQGKLLEKRRPSLVKPKPVVTKPVQPTPVDPVDDGPSDVPPPETIPVPIAD